MRGLIVFVAWSLIEISLFVTLGSWIGLLGTLAVIGGTGFAGVMILRGQGTRLGQAIRGNAAGLLAHSGLTSIAAVLLIMPGFLTDMLGAVLLVPMVRHAIIDRVGSRIRAATVQTPGQTRRSGDVVDAVAIDLTAERLHDTTGPAAGPRSGPPSGWTKP